jgi:hypothetical protein
MPHYLVEYAEIGSPEAREAGRADHIAYRKGLGERLRLAGPLLDDDGKNTGSVVIIEAEDRAAASGMALADPLVVRGVLELVSVRALRIAMVRPLPSPQ